MKNFSFTRKASVIQTLQEPPQPKKRFNWQRWMWIAIIGFALFKLGAYIYQGLAETHAEGQIEFGKQTVSFVQDVQLLHLQVGEGDHIKTGDTLFWYRNQLDSKTAAEVERQTASPVEWVERELLQTEQQIALKRIEQQRLSKSLAAAHVQQQEQIELVVLGAHSRREHLGDLAAQVRTLEANTQAVDQEIRYLQRYRGKLQAQARKMQQLQERPYQDLAAPQPYLAQTDGIIGQINVEAQEICYEQQPLLTIHQSEAIRIRAYFDQEELPFLKQGDIVQVRFPDGSRGQGEVANFHIATAALPSEFQKKYEPTERNIVVDILPLSQTEATRWSAFYKMTVELSKTKYPVLP